MGRTIPSSSRAVLSATTAPPIPLLMAGIAASIAILFTLCMSHHRSKSSAPRSPSMHPNPFTSPHQVIKNSAALPPPQSLVQVQESLPDDEKEEEVKKASTPGPTGPAAAGAALLVSSSSPAAAARQRLLVSLSMRIPNGLSRIRTSRKRRHGSESNSHRHKAAVSEGGKEVEAEAEEEESVWMKRIILGERCKVDEEDEPVVVYDIKGNRQRNYHPRTTRSLPVSRTNSFAAADAKAASGPAP